MDFDVSYAGALIAGLLSFVSPCVLPLVPPYLCFIGGVSLDQIAAAETNPDREVARRVFISAVAFVLGFTTVFVALGASASVVSQALTTAAPFLAKVAGAVIAVFGLHFLGVLRLGFLDREIRHHPDRQPGGIAGAYAVGLAFAFGWTPCIGPVLATILTIAAAQDTVGRGAALLGVYALGIGVPFLLAALFIRPFLSGMRRFGFALRHVERVMGALLVATGLLIAFGSFDAIGYWLLQIFPGLGRIG
jgi:cytochrome c-type biogenesis protein